MDELQTFAAVGYGTRSGSYGLSLLLSVLNLSHPHNPLCWSWWLTCVYDQNPHSSVVIPFSNQDCCTSPITATMCQRSSKRCPSGSPKVNKRSFCLCHGTVILLFLLIRVGYLWQVGDSLFAR